MKTEGSSFYSAEWADDKKRKGGGDNDNEGKPPKVPQVPKVPKNNDPKPPKPPKPPKMPKGVIDESDSDSKSE